MKVTAKQVAEKLDVSYVIASGIMSHLLKTGQATVVEKIFNENRKGKPTRVYEVNENVVIKLA